MTKQRKTLSSIDEGTFKFHARTISVPYNNNTPSDATSSKATNNDNNGERLNTVLRSKEVLGSNDADDNSPQSTTSTTELFYNKFERLREHFERKKTNLVWMRQYADTYYQLEQDNPLWTAEQLDQKTREELDAMKDVIDERVKQEISILTTALHDPKEFMRYFFEELVPVMEECEHTKILQQRYDPVERQGCRDEKLSEWQTENDLTVKLMLTSLADHGEDTPSIVRWIIKQYAITTTEYGLNHAALQIGPYIIEWNNSGVVIPRVLKASKNILMIIPVNDSATLKRSRKNLNAISEFIVKWNNRYHYSTKNNITNFKGNCHLFVDQFLQTLRARAGYSPNWAERGPIAQFIEKIKQNQIGDILKVWDMDGNVHEFHTQDDLRLYHEKLQALDPIPDYFEEMVALLKSMERVLQLRQAAMELKRLQEQQQQHLLAGCGTQESGANQDGDAIVSKSATNGNNGNNTTIAPQPQPQPQPQQKTQTRLSKVDKTKTTHLLSPTAVMMGVAAFAFADTASREDGTRLKGM